MRLVTIIVHMGTAAFEEDPDELAKVLATAAHNVRESRGGFATSLHDTNGNTCGRLEVEEIKD